MGVFNQSLYQLFLGTNATTLHMDTFKSNRNIRGVRCDAWSKNITSLPWWPNTPCQLTCTIYVSANGTEVNAVYERAPMRVTLVGVVGTFAYNHEYDIFGYALYVPSANEKSERFANCANQALIYNALSQVAQNAALPIVVQNNAVGLFILVFVIGVVIGVLGGIVTLCVVRKYRGTPAKFVKVGESDGKDVALNEA